MAALLNLIIPACVLFLSFVVGLLMYVALRYSPIVARIFEEKPLFLPLRVSPVEGLEEARFRTHDGLELVGTHFPHRTEKRLGTIVFCHEYMSDRWSVIPYADHLRDRGFDLFSFDFRNHGQSQSDGVYQPMQWVSGHEVADLRAALRYLRGRDDFDPAGYALMGVSRGGGTALAVAGKDLSVWGVVTDGAFPTTGTMLAYIKKWAEIYVSRGSFWKLMPRGLFEFLCWVARKQSQRRLHCRYPDIERAVSKIGPRPLLMIHGEKDAYIPAGISRELFSLAAEPKELWIVPKAKHNRCRDAQPEPYREKVAGFFLANAPRSTETSETPATTAVNTTVHASTIASPIALQPEPAV